MKKNFVIGAGFIDNNNWNRVTTITTTTCFRLSFIEIEMNWKLDIETDGSGRTMVVLLLVRDHPIVLLNMDTFNPSPPTLDLKS